MDSNKKRFDLTIWHFADEGYWEIDLQGIHVKANTLRQAFVVLGNALKRVKKEELEKIWGEAV